MSPKVSSLFVRVISIVFCSVTVFVGKHFIFIYYRILFQEMYFTNVNSVPDGVYR